uniref:THUMP domain-containing protein n=1 Tax=Tetraodon nigroviridis TaxID=99883 RepID=H3CWS2_TETNG
IEEVKKKLAAEDIYQIPGKVIFSSSADIHKICQLKAAERLFLLMKQDHPVSLSAKTNPAKAASVLQSRLLGDADPWTSSVLTWRRLQGALEHSSYSVNRLKGRTGEKSDDVRMSGEQSGADTTERKRKRDEDSDDAGTEKSEEHAKKGNQTPMRASATQPPPASVSFRISCKCTGSLSRYLAEDVSRVIGVGLSRLLGWKVDLKNPQVEVNIHLSDDYCLMGIPLTRLPLANRYYIKSTGLRSTIAWAIASLAQIQ